MNRFSGHGHAPKTGASPLVPTAAMAERRGLAAKAQAIAGPVMDVEPERWKQRLRYAASASAWPRGEWGPAPGEPGYAGPKTDHDGKGWADRSPVDLEGAR